MAAFVFFVLVLCFIAWDRWDRGMLDGSEAGLHWSMRYGSDAKWSRALLLRKRRRLPRPS